MKYNQILSEYFTQKPLYLDYQPCHNPNIRKLAEQPWQQTKAMMFNEIIETLCDISFVECKVKANMVDGLQEDYRRALKTGKKKEYISTFYDALMMEQHHLRLNPSYTFGCIYNRLWWKNDLIIKRLDNAMEEYINRDGCFLKQYREPTIIKSHLIMTLTGHAAWISSVAISPDGRWVVSGAGDKTIKIWDAETGKELTNISGHTMEITTCAFSPDGSRILSGEGSIVIPERGDNTLKIWDINTKKELAIFNCEYKCVSCSFSPCGTKVVCGDQGGNLYFFKLKGFKKETVIVTASRLWLFRRGGKNDQWAEDIIFLYPSCGIRHSMAPFVLDAIQDIYHKYNFNPTDSLCHVLPKESWDEPKLISECPKSKEKIRFNPFIVDNKGKWD